MCFTVSTAIHPTSAAIGTDDDMRGNDKPTPSLRPWIARELEAFSATSFQTRPIGPVSPFMTSPKALCTCRARGKSIVNDKCGSDANRRNPAGPRRDSTICDPAGCGYHATPRIFFGNCDSDGGFQPVGSPSRGRAPALKLACELVRHELQMPR